MEFLVLDEDIAVPLGEDQSWDSADQDHFFIDNGVWCVSQGTIWDGATAVPDGSEHPDKPGYPALWLASLIHDLGYMYMDREDFPYTRREIDDLFIQLMKQVDFPFALIYYIGVRWFGGIWNTIFKTYRRVFNRERQLPAHLSDYTDTEMSIYTIGHDEISK